MFVSYEPGKPVTILLPNILFKRDKYVYLGYILDRIAKNP